MTQEDRQLLKKRLRRATTQTAREFRELSSQGRRDDADLAHERWKILFRAAQDIDNFEE